MNKQEFIRLVALDSELTQKQVSNALDSVLNVIMDTVASGESIQFVGFGTFSSRERSARVGRNPQTNEPVEIPAATVPVFRAGTIFKEKVDR